MRPEPRRDAEARADLEDRFPGLRGLDWKLKSPFDRTYKCIAWAACRTDHIWWPEEDDPLPPGVFWPPGIARNQRVDTFVQAFEQLGYKRSESNNTDFEFGYRKVAIYAWNEDKTTHMARQHFCGIGWLSKLGALEDIQHPTLECIQSEPPHSGYDYGVVHVILKRSWWQALVGLCLLRCAWYAFYFWLYRLLRRAMGTAMVSTYEI